MSYEEFRTVREETVDGIGPWYWVNTDYGAWDGPKKDWEENHSHKWLSRVTNWDACVQAGGCLGMYPRLLARRFHSVYTFEPDPLNFYFLNLNCQLDNIYKLNAAVGESHVPVQVVRASMQNVGMGKTEEMNGCIPQFMIDDLELQSCGLIALDIEGNELKAVRGAIKTIERCKPVITCENGNNEIKELLHRYGYHVVGTSVADTIYDIKP